MNDHPIMVSIHRRSSLRRQAENDQDVKSRHDRAYPLTIDSTGILDLLDTIEFYEERANAYKELSKALEAHLDHPGLSTIQWLVNAKKLLADAEVREWVER